MRPINRRLRCTLAFFGIDRRLDLTGESIHKLIHDPAARRFEVSSVGFLWAPQQISNPRSGEEIALPPPRFDCLPPGLYDSAPPLDLEAEPRFHELKSFGDFWDDGFRSFSNLYSQLNSLSRATEMALLTQPDIVIFLRPDLLYRDSFANVLDRAATAEAPGVFLPHWQPHGGLNDRFALCCGKETIRAYGHRVEAATEFCRTKGHSLHSEKLLRYALTNIPVARVGLRAARMRVDGAVKHEDYSYRGWKPALRVLAGALRQRVMLK